MDTKILWYANFSHLSNPHPNNLTLIRVAIYFSWFPCDRRLSTEFDRCYNLYRNVYQVGLKDIVVSIGSTVINFDKDIK